MRRSEGSPLDLNNLPEDYGKQIVEESSTTTAASAEPARLKKKKGGGKDESGKVYECRFCSLKFCKSQALGGHMNRHRQERETETLNRARQLVYSNEGLSAGGVMRDVNGVQPGGGSQMSESQWVQFRQLYPRLPAHCQSAPNAHHHHHHHPCNNNNNNNNNNNMVQGGSFWASALQPVSGGDNYCVGHVLPAAAISRFEPSYPCFGDIRAANRINQMDIGINNSSWGCTTAFAYDPTSDNIF